MPGERTFLQVMCVPLIFNRTYLFTFPHTTKLHIHCPTNCNFPHKLCFLYLKIFGTGLNETLQLWMNCRSTRTLIDITTQCLSCLMHSNTEACIVALLGTNCYLFNTNHKRYENHGGGLLLYFESDLCAC